MRTRSTFSLVLLFLSGCGSMFDFSGPPEPVGKNSQPLTVISFGGAVTAAGEYKAYYQMRTDHVANGFQVFELPIIGGAITGVSALAFHSNKAIPLAAGLVAGGATVLESFYDPRDRVQIYYTGRNAMACIQREAAQATAVYLVDNNENVNNFKPAFNELPGLIATADAASKPGYQTALNVGYNGAKGLDDAMGAINASIVTQALNKSVRPDVQKISTEISSSLNQQQTKTKDAEAANSSSGHRKLEHALDIMQADIDITNMVNFAATFDKDITACKTLAGA